MDPHQTLHGTAQWPGLVGTQAGAYQAMLCVERYNVVYVTSRSSVVI